ncbi:unnamed protein product [Penicillium olsonii]|nr:unnamed protein product [Penicillium olsonii]CAG7928269.1 unnamed protein product [Penicillium olsonii]
MALGSESADGHCRALGRLAWDSDILDLADLQHWACTRNQNTTGPGGLHGLEVHLLIVDDMLVVECDILGVQQVFD